MRKKKEKKMWIIQVGLHVLINTKYSTCNNIDTRMLSKFSRHGIIITKQIQIYNTRKSKQHKNDERFFVVNVHKCIYNIPNLVNYTCTTYFLHDNTED